MRERTIKTAEQFSILNKVENLEKDLMAVDGVADVEFDLDGFYDNMNQVIVLTKYNIQGSAGKYFKKRRQLLCDVQDVAYTHDLRRTGDRIEDYGEHFYFVFTCGDKWKI